MADTKRIALIDGNSLLYRAFFALPTSLATKSGQVTNAVYGFATMLLKLIDERKPEALIVAFDKGRVTFRHQMLETYKANRPKMPDDLVGQLPIIRELLEAMEIPTFEIDGFEADDILATLAKKAEAKGYEVDIVTGDKDALQLVSDRTSVITTKKGITDIKIFQPQDVVEKYGVGPDGIRDWLALKGDTSDNIPGVPGIGEKTATDLLRNYGSVENLIDNIDDLKSERVKKALKEHSEEIELAKSIVTLVYDVDIEVDWDSSHLHPWNREKLGPLLKALEFNSLYERLFALDYRQDQLFSLEEQTDLQIVDNAGGFDKVIDKAASAEFIAIHIYVSEQDQPRLYLKVGRDLYEAIISENTKEGFAKVLGSDILKVVHDNKRMFHICEEHGLPWSGPKFDVMLAAYIDDPSNGAYGLKDLALRYLQKGLESSHDSMASSVVIVLSELYEKLSDLLSSQEALELLNKVEMPLSEVLAEMESAGVAIDVDYLARLGQEVSAELDGICQRLYELAGCVFNVNSSQQIADVLFGKLGLKGRKKTKTGYSTDIGVLEQMQAEHEIIPLIIRWRELNKMRSTYIFTLPELTDPNDGRLHTHFNQVGTATGRLASSNPNLQNIPIRTELGLRVRKAFVAGGPGMKLITADYSQIELRLLAHLSKDEMLMTAFKNDEDIHSRTASEVFGVPLGDVDREKRRLAKAINFGIVYGMSAFGLSKQINVSAEEAQRFIDNYFHVHKGVRKYIDKMINETAEKGFVATILNRRRYVPELRSSNPRVRQLGERLAINSPLQGGAADIIKLAMISISEAMKDKGGSAEMILQIHDELMFRVLEEEVREMTGLVVSRMENAYPLDVKLKVDASIVDDWGQAKE